jgi:DnaK suppressor protein
MEIRERIERELDQLQWRLRPYGGVAELEDEATVAIDPASAADLLDGVNQNADREMSFATRSLLVQRRNQLAVALERIQDGTYGICEECQKPIPPARFQAIPEATTCVPCQSRRERRRLRDERDVAFVGDGELA